MIVTIMDAIWTLLKNDATLQGYLGGTDRVVIGWVNQSTKFPCITIYESNESSYPRVGYSGTGHRDNVVSVQIDTWVDKSNVGFPCTARDLNVIADRVDELLFGTPITSTRNWRRSSSIEQQETSKLTTLFHKTRRYEFEYSVHD